MEIDQKLKFIELVELLESGLNGFPHEKRIEAFWLTLKDKPYDIVEKAVILTLKDPNQQSMVTTGKLRQTCIDLHNSDILKNRPKQDATEELVPMPQEVREQLRKTLEIMEDEE